MAPAHLPGKVTFPLIQNAGSPYFLEDWVRGEVLLNNGRVADGILLRYDGYSDRLLWLVSDEAYKHVEVDKYLVARFVFHQADTSFYFSRVDVSALSGFTESQAFMQVLQEGLVSLLVFRGVRISSRLGPVTDKQGRVRQALTMISEPRYYLQFPNGTLQRIKLRRRSFMQAIDEHMPGASERLRGQNLRFRTEHQMASTVFLLNSLTGK